MFDMNGLEIRVYFGAFVIIVAFLGGGFLLYHLIMAVVQYVTG